MVGTILTFIGGSAVLLAAVAWLVRSLFIHILNKDAEKFKEMLKRESALASRLQEERAKVIVEIYGLLVDLYVSIARFVEPTSVSDTPSKDDLAKDVYEKLSAFNEGFERKKIYLESTVCEQIDEFSRSFVAPALKFNLARKMAESNTIGQPPIDMHEKWFEAVDKMEKEVPEAKAALEAEFRELLGINKID